MKRIIKSSNEPTGLKRWKEQELDRLESLYSRGNVKQIWGHLPSSTPKVVEDGITYFTKSELRKFLHLEQGAICCYCQKMINLDISGSDIEHYNLQSTNPRLNTFNYFNLGLSCAWIKNYNIDQIEFHNPTCNSARKNQELTIYPIHNDVEDFFSFTLDGQIMGLTPNAKQAIKILNLGCDKLNKQRKSAIEAYIFTIDGTICNEKDLSDNLLKCKLTSGGCFNEYFTAVLYCINDQLSVLNS